MNLSSIADSHAIVSSLSHGDFERKLEGPGGKVTRQSILEALNIDSVEPHLSHAQVHHNTHLNPHKYINIHKHATACSNTSEPSFVFH